MSRKYKFHDNSKLYFITYTVVGWVDLFIREDYKKVLLESWKFCQKHKDLEIYGWCIMSSHVHMIIGSSGRELFKIVGEMKSYTSRSLRKIIQSNIHESRRGWMIEIFKNSGLENSNNKDWQIWQQHNHPIEIFTESMFHQKLNYIHNNPLVAGIVDKQEDYVYSSAIDFTEGKGLIDLHYIV